MKEQAGMVLKKERLDYWLGVGAQPSESFKRLLTTYQHAQEAAAE